MKTITIEDCIEELENMSDEKLDDLLEKANFEYYNSLREIDFLVIDKRTSCE